MENGKHVLYNNGKTIGYGHDLTDDEIQSGIYNEGINESLATKLLLLDLERVYNRVIGTIKSLNQNYGYSININSFSEQERDALVDFSFNRGMGLVQRPELKNSGKPYSSLAISIVAVSEKNSTKLWNTLSTETQNMQGKFYSGLESRRKNEYKIYQYGDYTRN